MARAQGDRKRGRKKNGITSHVLIFFLCISLMTLGKADISAMNSLRTIMTGLTMPIADVVYQVVCEGFPLEKAVEQLLDRPFAK